MGSADLQSDNWPELERIDRLSAASTRLLLVRHGQSTWNAEGRWQGQADPPLSDLGRRQALAAAQRIGTVDAIIASPQQRAAQTATIISEAIGIGPLVHIDDLRERHAGPWSGMTRHEIDEHYPGFLDEGHRPVGYETDLDLTTRTTGALAALAIAFPGASLLVVTHGGVIHNLELQLGLEAGRVPNLAGRLFLAEGDDLTADEALFLADAHERSGGDPDRL